MIDVRNIGQDFMYGGEEFEQPFIPRAPVAPAPAAPPTGGGIDPRMSIPIQQPFAPIGGQRDVGGGVTMGWSGTPGPGSPGVSTGQQQPFAPVQPPPPVPPPEEPWVAGTCFIAGTKISKPDGTLENIEDIKTGDTVVTYDAKNTKIGFGDVKTLFHHAPEETAPYYLVINNKLKVTPNHELFTNNGLIPVGDLDIGSVLVSENQGLVPIASISRVFEKVPTYNLEVEGNPTYFADGFAVHNKIPPDEVTYPPPPPAPVMSPETHPLGGTQQLPGGITMGWSGTPGPQGGGIPGQQPWQPTQAAPPGGEGFPYPTQWGTASTALTELAQTGMPGITPEYAEKAWLPYQRRGQQEAMQAREQAGLGGMRWSTPLAGQLEDIWGGASERFGAGMEQMRMQDIAGQRGARLGATGQLMGLGGQYAQLPLNVSQTMMGLGGAQQQMQQQMLDRQREEWLRQQPEYNPLLQYMYGGGQMPTGPSTYGPSFGGQMFDIAGQMGLAQQLGLFGGGGGGVPTAPLGGGTPPAEWGALR